MKYSILHQHAGRVLVVALLALASPNAFAQGPSLPNPLTVPPPDLSRAPIVPLRILVMPVLDVPTPPPSRVRVFRMQPGFLSDVPWLTDEDQTTGAPKALDPDPEPDFFSISYGTDNPNFDFRTAGDPGGVGFARVNSQLQLFDTSKTALCLGMQAVTPLGLAYDGIADSRGTTVVTPGFSLFHEIDEGFGVQAFVSKNLPVENKSVQVIHRDVKYGIAFNRAVTTNKADPFSNLFLSVGALGKSTIDPDGGRTLNWDVMPGMHYRLAESWWVSGGVLLPVGPTRAENGGHWRLTCQWQF